MPTNPRRPGVRGERGLGGPLDDVVGPAVAVDHRAAGQSAPVEPDAVAQDLGTGQLGDRFARCEGGGGGLEIDPVDLDPAAARLHERSGLVGQPPHLGGGQLDVVEERRPG